MLASFDDSASRPNHAPPFCTRSSPHDPATGEQKRPPLAGAVPAPQADVVP